MTIGHKRSWLSFSSLQLAPADPLIVISLRTLKGLCLETGAAMTADWITHGRGLYCPPRVHAAFIWWRSFPVRYWDERRERLEHATTEP